MYLNWNNKTITDLSDENIKKLYDEGFLFTRTGKGEMYQTRSLRIDLSKFELSSENRRVLRNTENISLEITNIPYSNYHWGIHKLGKDFYSTKFGDKTFSAQKIKELITDKAKSNFNKLFIYRQKADNLAVGYAICLEKNDLLHYCYPFYDLKAEIKNLGIGMMTKAIVWAQENNKKYIYLGSASRSADTYKLQFEGLEWWDGKNWQTNLVKLKAEIK
jgi:arginyl-tRNA--protein-N-Asp/Glu arginylyltransferase